jgi:hypothetical protein
MRAGGRGSVWSRGLFERRLGRSSDKVTLSGTNLKCALLLIKNEVCILKCLENPKINSGIHKHGSYIGGKFW